MPLSRKRLEQIEPSHRIRPYLCVRKNRIFMYGYMCTSKEYLTGKSKQKFEIDPKKYQNAKDSFFIDLRQPFVIPLWKILNIHIRLDAEDRMKITKRLNIPSETILNFKDEVVYEAGDVIAKNSKYYYILDKTTDFFKLIEVKKATSKGVQFDTLITIGNQKYSYDSKNIYCFVKLADYFITNVAKAEEIRKIRDKILKG